MGDFFRSVKFRVILCILALLVGVMIYAVSMGGYTISTVGIFNTVAAPFQRASNAISTRVEHALQVYGDAEDTFEENRALRREVAELHTQLSGYEDTRQELEELQAFMGIKERHEDYTLSAPCEVIGFVTNDPYGAFMIDGGEEDGIHLYDPVVTELGLVGIVSELGAQTSTVTTILSPDLNIAACSSSAGDRGVLTGTVALSQEGLCKLQYLSRDTKMKKEQVILTTGENGLFPRGYVIGYVKDVQPDDSGMTAYAAVEPAADLSGMAKVVVITDFAGKGRLTEKEAQTDADGQ
ncbi:MAG: rod shape-determining protein MreC [Oscillospiraceae bacterium]|nr:rod shape-determining protein MreC [Oscillospiraceae bacterium]